MLRSSSKAAEFRANCGRHFTKAGRGLVKLWSIKGTRMGLVLLPFISIITVLLYTWTTQSNSFAMNAFMCLLVFDIIVLLGDSLTKLYVSGGKPSITYSFGFGRFEVLSHFSILSLGLFLNLWSLRVLITLALFGTEGEEIHTGRFIPSIILGSVAHFSACVGSNILNKLPKLFCTTTTLQRCFYRVFNSFGLSIPPATTSFLTPFTTLGVFSTAIMMGLNFTLHAGSRYIDFIGGVLILFAMFDAVWPLFRHTAQILLQTVPTHIAVHLEKILNESLTLDGVLEFRNELFWTVSYGQIAGTLHVRIRRDASEQVILVKLHDKLQAIAPHLTIQVTKDDFGRTFGNLHLICDAPRTNFSTDSAAVGLVPVSCTESNSLLERNVYSSSSLQDYVPSSTNGNFSTGAFAAPGVEEFPTIRELRDSKLLAGKGRQGTHSRSASLDDSRRNPFIIHPSTPPGSQPNMLILSANHFSDY